jgi:hypothetical protein
VLVFRVPVPSADIQPYRGMPQASIGGANPGWLFWRSIGAKFGAAFTPEPKISGKLQIG